MSTGGFLMRASLAATLTVIGATLPAAAVAQVNYDLVSTHFEISLPTDHQVVGNFGAVVISFKTNKYYSCEASTAPNQDTIIKCPQQAGNFNFLSGNNVKSVAPLPVPVRDAVDGWASFWQIDRTKGVVNFCDGETQPPHKACASTQVD
jgi:hypothetical protein